MRKQPVFAKQDREHAFIETYGETQLESCAKPRLAMKKVYDS